MTLWASAIAAGDGEMPIGRIVAAYPTIPFLATTLLEFVTPAGTPTPVLLTAGVLALLAGALARFVPPRGPAAARRPLMVASARSASGDAARGDRRTGGNVPRRVSVPARRRAVTTCARAARAPEVMAVALALLGLAFSHPMGAALACAAMPLLVFAVRPELLSRARLSTCVIALVFPTVFCVAAFSYMSWVFPGSGWSFLIAPAEGVATWAAGFSRLFGRGLTGSLALDAGLAVVVALLLGAPARSGRDRLGMAAPAAGRAGAGDRRDDGRWRPGIAVPTGLFGDPAAVAVMPPILAAIIIMRVPVGARAACARPAAARRRLVRRHRRARDRRSARRDECARRARGTRRRPRSASPRSISATRRSGVTAFWSIRSTRRPSCSAAAARADCCRRPTRRSRSACCSPASIRRSWPCRIRRSASARRTG